MSEYQVPRKMKPSPTSGNTDPSAPQLAHAPTGAANNKTADDTKVVAPDAQQRNGSDDHATESEDRCMPNPVSKSASQGEEKQESAGTSSSPTTIKHRLFRERDLTPSESSEKKKKKKSALKDGTAPSSSEKGVDSAKKKKIRDESSPESAPKKKKSKTTTTTTPSDTITGMAKNQMKTRNASSSIHKEKESLNFGQRTALSARKRREKLAAQIAAKNRAAILEMERRQRMEQKAKKRRRKIIPKEHEAYEGCIAHAVLQRLNKTDSFLVKKDPCRPSMEGRKGEKDDPANIHKKKKKKKTTRPPDFTLFKSGDEEDDDDGDSVTDDGDGDNRNRKKHGKESVEKMSGNRMSPSAGSDGGGGGGGSGGADYNRTSGVTTRSSNKVVPTITLKSHNVMLPATSSVENVKLVRVKHGPYANFIGTVIPDDERDVVPERTCTVKEDVVEYLMPRRKNPTPSHQEGTRALGNPRPLSTQHDIEQLFLDTLLNLKPESHSGKSRDDPACGPSSYGYDFALKELRPKTQVDDIRPEAEVDDTETDLVVM